MGTHLINKTEDYPVSIEAFFAAITDYEAYPEIIEPIRAVKVLKVLKNGARVRFDAHYFRDVYYTLELTHREPFEVSWELIEGDAFQYMSGAWELESIETGLTRVSYEAELALHIAAPGFIVRRTMQHNVAPMMDAFFEYAQKLARRK